MTNDLDSTVQRIRSFFLRLSMTNNPRKLVQCPLELVSSVHMEVVIEIPVMVLNLIMVRVCGRRLMSGGLLKLKVERNLEKLVIPKTRATSTHTMFVRTGTSTKARNVKSTALTSLVKVTSNGVLLSKLGTLRGRSTVVKGA